MAGKAKAKFYTIKYFRVQIKFIVLNELFKKNLPQTVKRLQTNRINDLSHVLLLIDPKNNIILFTHNTFHVWHVVPTLLTVQVNQNQRGSRSHDSNLWHAQHFLT